MESRTKTDNFTKVLLSSIVILLGIMVVKDIDLPPKAHANFLGNNSKYQVECGQSRCLLYNTQSGIAKVISPDSPKKEDKWQVHQLGDKADF